MRSDDEAPVTASSGAETTLEAVQQALDTADDEKGLEQLIPKGNPARPRRLWWALAALVPVFLLMATDGHFALSVPVCAVGLLIATFALLDALGTFDDAKSGAESSALEPAAEGPPRLRSVAPRLAELVCALVAATFALRLVVAGVLPRPVLSAAILVTLSLIAIVVALCRVAEALRIFDAAGARWFARRGFWLVLLNVLLYVPLLGSYSLSDPWEVHYGEVAREMLARDDWISLWWAQDGWFWSKPVLDFWLQGVSFSLTGVHFMPDQMLAAASAGFRAGAGVARAPARLRAHRRRQLLPVQGSREGLRRTRRLLGGPGAHDRALLVSDRAPEHDGHAVRGAAHRGPFVAGARNVYAIQKRRFELSSSARARACCACRPFICSSAACCSRCCRSSCTY